MFKMSEKFIFMKKLLFITIISKVCAFRSPCPDIFEYKFNEYGVLYGNIQINSNEFDSIVHLQVELLVTNQLVGSDGSIEIPYSDIELVNKVTKKMPIHYNVIFPKWKQFVPPIITLISVNNKVICKGPQVLLSSGSTHTTILLDHTIKIIDDKPNSLDKRTSNESANFFYDPIRNPFNFKPRFPRRGPIKIIWRSLNDPFEKGQKDLNPEVKDKCGIAVTANSLMYHGQAVPEGSLPWLVALYEVKSKLVYKCCGSLISHKHVITAAHCVDRNRKPNAYVLRFGKMNLNDWKPDPEEKLTVAKSIYVHPDYVPFSANADLAIITISGKVHFTNFIRPLCLWSGPNDLSQVVGENGMVAGWGKNENSIPNYDAPTKATMPIVSQEKCLRSAYEFRDITSENTFCAGFRNGSGPCNGDSGGGFIMKRGGRWILRGIVSMSLSSKEAQCDLNSFVVFVDVSKYIKWVMDTILL